MRSKSRGQTCLYYALQGGGKDREAGLNEKDYAERGTRLYLFVYLYLVSFYNANLCFGNNIGVTCVTFGCPRKLVCFISSH